MSSTLFNGFQTKLTVYIQCEVSLPGGSVGPAVVSDAGIPVGTSITWSQRSPVKEVAQLYEQTI